MDQKKSFDSSEWTMLHSDDIPIFDVENTSSENQNGLLEISNGFGTRAPSERMNLGELKGKQIVDFSAKCVTTRQATPMAHPQTQGLASEASSTPKRKSKIASNFHFSLIKIGNWERKSNYYKDLRAKIDYLRRKFAWEILDDKMKTKMKIEIKWSDILSMRAVLNDCRNDTLEVELEVPPMYFVEDEPKPQKYISWFLSTDFTGEQANLNRIHHLQLRAGKLKKHYAKFVQWDSSTLSLSKKKFPSAATPFFDVINQTLRFRPLHPTRFQYPTLSFRQPIPSTSQQPQQLQYLIQPIPRPPICTIPSPPPVFIRNCYSDYPVLSPPARGNTVSTRILILPRAPVWPSGQTMESRLMNQFVYPVQQVQPTVQVPPLHENSPTSLFQVMEGNELNQTRSQNEDVEISTNKMSLEEIEICLLTDVPSDLQPNEEKILDAVNSMMHLLK